MTASATGAFGQAATVTPAQTPSTAPPDQGTPDPSTPDSDTPEPGTPTGSSTPPEPSKPTESGTTGSGTQTEPNESTGPSEPADSGTQSQPSSPADTSEQAKLMEKRTAALKVPEEVKEEVENELSGLLKMSKDTDIPTSERAAYTRIVSRLTDALEAIQDPKTPREQRVAYTHIVERSAETLGVMQEPGTPREDRSAYAKIVDGTVKTVGTIQDPKTPREQRATYTEFTEEMTERFGLFTDQEAPEDFRTFALRNTERDVETLTRAQGQRTPQKYHEWTVRAMSDSGTSQQILRNRALPPKQRAELQPKQQAELKRNVEQLSKNVRKSYDRSASQDERDKAKDEGEEFLKKIKKANGKHSDKPLLEIRNKPLSSAVAPGEFQSFTVKVTNHGDEDVTGVTVEDEFDSASGRADGGVIHPVLHAQLMTESAAENDCDITAGDTVVTCPTKGDTNIVPEETVTITIRAVVKASRVPSGEQENVTQVKHEEGAQQGSAKFAVVKPPKLSEQDLEGELRAIRQCAAHFDSPGVSREALAVFTEVMSDEIAQGTSPAQASAEGYKAALTRAGPDEAVSLAAIRVFDVSLRDAAKAFKSADDCPAFVDKALSAE
ncbi:DUF11 domain-containing protein [Streptomyces violaceus]|uniref:DUF11 domain-containing protein n=1 Tax=Streptomyces violaceus TaxID=1936 RepID=A0ABY9UBZ6_STRVL|nr:DUF11 domain-containing protein [Streptomyces janthinus]WND20335.1 DUF11 domain-containing protein [Streptomyces janthinus]GGS65507.1 hypothetical protein GCM10010270_41020 [Streptomyces janthinus]